MTDVALETKRVDLTFSKMGIREPFIAAVMSKIERQVCRDVPTAATNGSWVKFNPDFTAKYDDAQVFGLSLHEALHIVLEHMWRRGNRDPQLWNYANDAYINAYILSRGYSLPDGGVLVDWVTLDMSSEEIYDRLKQEMDDASNPDDGDTGDSPDGGQGDGDGDEGDTGGSSGAGGSSSGGSSKYPAGGFDGQGDLEDAVDETARADLQATIIASAKMAKECGQGSALIDRILEDIGKASVSWADVLRNMMSESSRSDYSYQRPRRRYVAQDLYLPALHSEAMGGLLIAADTSGSMWSNPKELAQVAGEINAIVADTNPAFVEVVYCDSAIQKVVRFEQGDEVKFEPPGGGGTAFEPVFNYIEESSDTYAGMIYFTDMCAPVGNLLEPTMPVIWADTSNGAYSKAPFGTQVPVIF